MAFHLLRSARDDNAALADAIKSVREQIHPCKNCGNFTDEDLCDICRAPRRENGQMCIVSEARDVLSIENSNEFYGRYHVLGGVINPLDGIGPGDLRLDNLLDRLQRRKHRRSHRRAIAHGRRRNHRFVFSVAFTRTRRQNVKVTQLARGLPFGGDLDYADQVTIAGALRGRREL